MSFSFLHSYHIVSNKHILYADKRSIESGICEDELIHNAAEAVIEIIMEKYPACFRVAILSGPGNNGGDGYFIAQLLREKKFRVTVYSVPQNSDCSAHTAHATKEYKGPVKSLTEFIPEKETLIVDALFGSGLKRPLQDNYSDIVDVVNNGKKAGVVSVDIPSGISGDTGHIMGCAIKAAYTVTFERLRYGHVLFPGHAYCGDVTVKSIGLNEIFLEKSTEGENDKEVSLNHPEIYTHHLPLPDPYLHKYSRGYVNIITGEVTMVNAAHLSSMGAVKMGAGIVRLGGPEAVLPILSMKDTSAVPYLLEDRNQLLNELSHPHLGCVVFGPGAGLERRSELMLDILMDHAQNNPEFKMVLDADALTILAEKNLEEISLNENIILTPHEGEFERLFPNINADDKLQRIRQAAEMLNATIILKGPDTLICTPTGRSIIQTRPLFNLAIAGSGDILSGMIAGLIARKMPVFEAACAAIDLHATAAENAPLYVTAHDLVKAVELPPLKY